MPPTIRELQKLLSQLEGPIARSFRQAVAQMKSQAQIARLESAIARGDMDAVMLAAGLRPGSWVPVTEAIRSAYIQGGQFAATANVPARYAFQFNPMNPRALSWLSTHSADLVVELNIKQREAINTAMVIGNQAGRNPRSVALDIVGRVGRTGRRQGGVIGLHEQFADYASNARAELQNLDSNYFTRVRRDRRYDAMVQKAIDSGKPLDKAAIEILTGRYEDRLLETRGQNIAQTETISAYGSSSNEAVEQVIEEGLARPDAVEKKWQHSFSGDSRPGHVALSGTKVPMGTPFINPENGIQLQFPGDGPASERIRCKCIVFHEIDFSKTVL